MIFFLFLAIVFRVWFGGWAVDSQQVFADVSQVAKTTQAQVALKTSQSTENTEATFIVEVARTPANLERGLMYRTHMDQNRGMLFVFSDAAPRTFWMKHTLIPLDMIFTTGDGTIVKIWHNVLPCRNATNLTVCPVYASGKPAKYVLEINGGLSQNMLLKEGDRMAIQGL